MTHHPWRRRKIHPRRLRKKVWGHRFDPRHKNESHGLRVDEGRFSGSLVVGGRKIPKTKQVTVQANLPRTIMTMTIRVPGWGPKLNEPRVNANRNKLVVEDRCLVCLEEANSKVKPRLRTMTKMTVVCWPCSKRRPTKRHQIIMKHHRMTTMVGCWLFYKRNRLPTNQNRTTTEMHQTMTAVCWPCYKGSKHRNNLQQATKMKRTTEVCWRSCKRSNWLMRGDQVMAAHYQH